MNPPGWTASQPNEALAVLLVSDLDQDYVSLQHILVESNWQLHRANGLQEGTAFLEKNHAPVVICERDLPDGDWKELLEIMTTLEKRPNLIVSSRLADERLWAEVLNLGGYDVLPTPFEPDEVFRVAYLAWQSAKRQWEQKPQCQKPPGREEAGGDSNKKGRAASGND